MVSKLSVDQPKTVADLGPVTSKPTRNTGSVPRMMIISSPSPNHAASKSVPPQPWFHRPRYAQICPEFTVSSLKSYGHVPLVGRHPFNASFTAAIKSAMVVRPSPFMSARHSCPCALPATSKNTTPKIAALIGLVLLLVNFD